jgi:hypothetical protein
MRIDPNTVTSREEFVSFVKLMRNDLAADPDDWENITLDDFLEALSAWVNDSERYFSSETPQPHLSWRNVAQILLAASAYE